MISGNTFRQYPNRKGYDILKLISCPGSAVDNNKMYAYSGNGFTAQDNSRTIGNIIVVADSNRMALRIWGGKSNFVIAQNMSNGQFSIASGTNAVTQNNITIESTAFKDVTFSLSNITADGLTKCLTDDNYVCTLTAAGIVTVYRVSGDVEITAGV